MTLNAATETSLANIRNIGLDIARLTQEAKEARKAAIEPFLDALAASGEVSLIVIYGYTPGFNDGEPCTHSGDYLVNILDLQESCDLDNDKFNLELPEELVEGLMNNRGDDAALCAKHGHVHKHPSADIMDAIANVVFETAEEEHGTNYYVAYVLKDGKFLMNSGEYDCDY